MERESLHSCHLLCRANAQFPGPGCVVSLAILRASSRQLQHGWELTSWREAFSSSGEAVAQPLCSSCPCLISYLTLHYLSAAHRGLWHSMRHEREQGPVIPLLFRQNSHWHLWALKQYSMLQVELFIVFSQSRLQPALTTDSTAQNLTLLSSHTAALTGPSAVST